MGRVSAFYDSLVGKKIIMAATGFILFGFIVGHLLGNLQIFLGAEPLNRYAAFLKSIGELLWVVRGVLIISFLLHVISSIQVALANRAARPLGYAHKKNIETNYAALTMQIGGPLIFLYVVYHLMMFTFLTTGPGYSHTDVYANVVASFKVPAISAVYIASMLLLGFHLYHGTWSMLHTLGISNAKSNGLRRALAPTVAVLVAGGYISIPVAVLAGLVG